MRVGTPEEPEPAEEAEEDEDDYQPPRNPPVHGNTINDMIGFFGSDGKISPQFRVITYNGNVLEEHAKQAFLVKLSKKLREVLVEIIRDRDKFLRETPKEKTPLQYYIHKVSDKMPELNSYQIYARPTGEYLEQFLNYGGRFVQIVNEISPLRTMKRTRKYASSTRMY
jgi:hypothetical protein